MSTDEERTLIQNSTSWVTTFGPGGLTRLAAVTDGFEFLGFHVTVRWNKRYGYSPRIEIPKAKAAALRRVVKQLT